MIERVYQDCERPDIRLQSLTEMSNLANSIDEVLLMRAYTDSRMQLSETCEKVAKNLLMPVDNVEDCMAL